MRAFTLQECEAYYREKGIDIPRYQVAEAYMIFGGIPFYMDFFRPKYSLAQNVDEIFFRENAPLRNEYTNLYRSLFRNPEGSCGQTGKYLILSLKKPWRTFKVSGV